jgi:BASS family bile acid:Na+ symporter
MSELYIRYEYWLAFFQLLFAMVGMGATLKLADFFAVAQAPNAFIVGLLTQVVGVPLVAWGILDALNVEPGVAIGLAILAAIPGGSTSNIFTHIARANVPLSIALSAVTTAFCLVTVPLVLKALISDYVPLGFELPAGKIAAEILITLLMPLAVGMAILHYLPKVAEPLSRWAVRLSLAIIVVMVVGAGLAGRLDWKAFGVDNALLVCGFAIGLAIIGFVVPKLLGLKLADEAAINIELSVRNVNLGVLIKASLFPATAATAAAAALGNMAFFAMLVYAVVMMVLAAILIALTRYRARINT